MKKIQIIIITVALVLTLGCVGTFAVLYFATDTFKSDKEMFYKYASQIDLKEFIDFESYNAYLKRLETQGHSNEGSFTIEIAQEEQTISESVKYNGYSDPVNKTANYDVSINKDNEALLEMNYLNKQDFYGILFKDVVNQYIVFENNNLKEFASKMGMQDTSEIPNKIEIPESNINYEELNSILNTYLKIAMEEIPEDNYLKIEKQDISLGDEKVEADGYQVKLKVKDVQKILTKVLEKARDDEQIYNLLNSQDITFEDYKVAIDELLLGLSEEIPSEKNVELITISVYKQGKDTVKFSMKLADEEETNKIELALEKVSIGMSLKYDYLNTTIAGTSENKIAITKTVNLEEQENFEIVISQESDTEDAQVIDIEVEPIIINVSRNGALTSNNVQFSTIATTKVQDIGIELEIRNTSNFAGVPKEGEFIEGNHLVINGLSSEQLNNLFTNLGSLLGERLREEIFVTLITNLTTVNNQLFDTTEQTQQEIQNTQEQQGVVGSMDNYLAEVFNYTYTPYEGIKKGSEIKSLYNIIESKNTVNPEHIVIYSGPSQEEIESSKTYNVSFSKDTEGYINQIIVEEVN